MLVPVLIGFFVSAFGVVAAPLIAHRLETPSCDDPLDLVQQQGLRAEGDAKTADSFPRKGTVAYGPDHLVDGNSSTAWVEGEDGLGIGAEVRVTLPEESAVQMVCLVDGYAESWELYQRNSRVRLMTAGTAQGERTSLLRDLGSTEHPAVYQQVNIATGRTSEITFTIRSAYAAQAPDPSAQTFADTSISEVEIWVSP